MDATSIVQFGPEFYVGVREIDDQHQRLFDIVAKIQQALLGDPEATLDKATEAVTELLDYTRYHFSHEEALMAAAAYPGLAEHQRLHQSLLAQVNDMELRVGLGDDSAALDLSVFLSHWLINHIQAVDKKVGAYLQSHC